MTGIKVSISVYGYTGYNLDTINISQTGRCRVTGWGSSINGYTVYNLGVINISHIGVN